MLHAVSQSISDAYLPYLHTSDAVWGKLNESDKSAAVTINLVNRLEGFVATLNSAQESIDDRIVFERCTAVDLTQLNNAGDYMFAAADM